MNEMKLGYKRTCSCNDAFIPLQMCSAHSRESASGVLPNPANLETSKEDFETKSRFRGVLPPDKDCVSHILT